MSLRTEIEIFKEDIKFSAAHFTIFSATERERLHGHNFSVGARVETPVGDDGLAFSYQELKRRLRALCDSLDEYLLLPADSPHLTITREAGEIRVRFDRELMTFLETDTLVLPIRNTTVEEFSSYLLQRLLGDDDFVAGNGIRTVEVSVASGPGQKGTSRWSAAT